MSIIDNETVTKTYTVTLAQMKALIAKDLGVNESKVTVRYVHTSSGDRFGGYDQSVSSIEVTVKS